MDTNAQQNSEDWQKSTKAVVVTLRRSTSRAANVQTILKRCPLSCEIWDATDGAQLDPAFVSEVYQPNLHRPNYPFKLRVGEIGCFLSHRNIWQQMVDQSIDRLLVVEDDIAFLPSFKLALKHAITEAPDGSYVQFQVRNVKFPHLALDEDCAQLVQPTIAPLRTSAQLVTLGAAKRLLDFSQQFDRPVDAAIQMTWLHGVQVLVALPHSVIEVSTELGGSTIGSSKKKRSIFETIQREVKRNWYRRSIAQCARRSSSNVQPQITLKKSA